MAPYLLTERVRKACRSLPNGLPEAIEHLLVSIQLLNERITKADAELAKLAEEHPTCKLLMTIPGIGPVTTLRFVAALDRVDRFPSAHAVKAFLGLVPGENSSSTRKQRTGITKAGPPRVRWALVQATSSFRRTSKNDPLVDWALEVEKR